MASLPLSQNDTWANLETRAYTWSVALAEFGDLATREAMNTVMTSHRFLPACAELNTFFQKMRNEHVARMTYQGSSPCQAAYYDKAEVERQIAEIKSEYTLPNGKFDVTRAFADVRAFLRGK